ncbi:MAG: nitrate reductase associated protein [Steroidobacteraceae bacterium]
MRHRSRLATLPAESPYPGIFRFEVDFGGTLRCIPMSVRMKLDQTGIKLSLRQWNRLPGDARRQLVERPCATAPEIHQYREYLAGMIEAHTRTAVEFAPLEASPPWADTREVPGRILQWAQSLGVAPPSAEQWAGLTPLQRFALFKLTRPGHSNENFLPAMREFSVLP